MSEFFLNLVNISIMAGWLIFAIIAIRTIFKSIPKWSLCILWCIVGLRLILPFSIESAFSLIPSVNTIDTKVDQTRPYIDSGITIVDNNVNDYLGSHYYEGVTVQTNTFDNLLSILTIIWLIGIIALFAYSIISYYKLSKRIAISIPYKNDIYISDEIDTPFIFGIYNPRIYVPSGMEENQMNYVLRHEHTHLTRKDHILKPLGFVLLSIYWFNPMIWIAYHLFCKDIEKACDEKVISQMNDDSKAAYLETLLLCSTNRKLILTCPLAFGEVGVKERVKSIVNYKKPTFWIIGVTIAVCVILGIGFLTNPKTEEKIDNVIFTYNETKDEYILNNEQKDKVLDLLKHYKFGTQVSNYPEEEPLYKIWYLKDIDAYSWSIYDGYLILEVYDAITSAYYPGTIYKFQDDSILEKLSKCEIDSENHPKDEIYYDLISVIQPFDNGYTNEDYNKAKGEDCLHDRGTYENNEFPKIKVKIQSDPHRLFTYIVIVYNLNENTHVKIYVNESDYEVIQNLLKEKGFIRTDKYDLVASIKVDGNIYMDTGCINKTDKRPKEADGMITSEVASNEWPEKNNQSNFGTNLKYQYGAIEGTIEVYIEDRDHWVIFATDEVRRTYDFTQHVEIPLK